MIFPKPREGRVQNDERRAIPQDDFLPTLIIDLSRRDRESDYRCALIDDEKLRKQDALLLRAGKVRGRDAAPGRAYYRARFAKRSIAPGACGLI